MAISDERQRIMPTAHDREVGQKLDYKEAVLLTNPNNSFIKGEVNFIINYEVTNIMIEIYTIINEYICIFCILDGRSAQGRDYPYYLVLVPLKFYVYVLG